MMILSWSNKLLQTSVHLMKPLRQIMMANAISLLVILVVCAAFPYIYPFLLNQSTWFFVAISLFAICVSSPVYSMTKARKLFNYKRVNGTKVYTELFLREMKGQYIGEGVIGAAIYSSIGLLYLLLSNVTYLARTAKGQRILVLLIIAAILGAQYAMVHVFKFKFKWYKPRFTPPKRFVKGSLAYNQGFRLQEQPYL
jgi:hypothetical protein